MNLASHDNLPQNLYFLRNHLHKLWIDPLSAQYIFYNGNLVYTAPHAIAIQKAIDATENISDFKINIEPHFFQNAIPEQACIIILYLNDMNNLHNTTLSSANNQTSIELILETGNTLSLVEYHYYLTQNDRKQYDSTQNISSGEDAQTSINHFTKINLKPASHLQHFILKQGHSESTENSSHNTVHITSQQECSLYQEEGSHYQGLAIGLEEGYNRASINIDLQGQGAKCRFVAGLMPFMKSKSELIVNINHQYPHCESECLVRTVAKDQGKAKFLGKIMNQQDAHGTSTHLENKCLLLSETAEVVTQPEFEILNDDLRRCTHGATVGHLDQNALFYLKSRGISEEMAKLMLIQAFMSPVFDEINLSCLQNFLKNIEPERLLQP